MIVDDEPMNILALESMLFAAGIETESQSSGVKAVEHLSELIHAGKPISKVLLIDFCMPGLDGPSTALEIRELCQDAGRPVPYMACCSAYTEYTFRQIALDSGMDAFYSKPLSNAQI
mmetsp:Transcript_34845/g.45878  ORF Transcript_34845/g.45878 Transcript_34845/m.45878 type:complete len:117 (-) Transcript_34845:106-456(-)